MLSNFIETVTATDFDNYSYKGAMVGKDGETMPNSSMHLVNYGDDKAVIYYDGVQDYIVVATCVEHDILLKASLYNGDWEINSEYPGELQLATLQHACRVMQRLHEVAIECS